MMEKRHQVITHPLTREDADDGVEDGPLDLPADHPANLLQFFRIQLIVCQPHVQQNPIRHPV